jgi:SAM-dependent methyltransferase
MTDANHEDTGNDLIHKVMKEFGLKYPESSVSGEISPDDIMHDTRHSHPYFRCGASALRVIKAGMSLADNPSAENILDFGCGHGRVMRWLRAEFPDAKITGTDVTEGGTLYCSEKFGSSAVTSGTDFLNLPSFHGQNLIWSGSVFTHLTERDASLLFDRFIDWLEDYGVAIFSTHGRLAAEHFTSGVMDYLPHQSRLKPMRDYFTRGYGFGGYEGSADYGVSFVQPGWYLERVLARRDLSLVCYSERAWDNHHDIVAVQKLPV